MSTRNLSIGIFALSALLSVAGSAQNNRSAVSVTGLDTNFCTVASPCRTFSRAISQTNPAGEVIALTSGGYGFFNVDRAISVIAPPGIYAATITPMLIATPITVNAPAGANVVIRGITLLNPYSGSTAIAIQANSGGSLVIDHMTMDGFDLNGCLRTSIDALVEDSTFRRCAYGVRVSNARAVVNRCIFTQTGADAVHVRDGGSGAARNCISNRSRNYAFTALAGGQLNIENSIATGSDLKGFASSGMGSVMRLSNCVGMDNSNGTLVSDSGVMESFGNNKLDGILFNVILVSQQ